MGEEGVAEVWRGEDLGTAGFRKAGGGRFQTGFHSCNGANYAAAARTSPMGHTGVSLVKGEYLLATTGWSNGRWDGGQLEVAQDARDERLLGDGGNDAP